MVKKLSNKINSNKSKYAKGSLKISNSLESNDSEEFNDEFDENDNENEDFQDDSMENDFQEVPSNGHLRSHGLFKNVWWKKGALKGFAVWITIVIIFYIFDFFGLVEVIDWKRWLFFLIFLVLIGITYEKFLFNKIKV